MYLYPKICPMMDKSDESSARDQRARVRGSTIETQPCILMVPGACKIHRECNVLKVLIQIILLEISKQGNHPLHLGPKF